MKLSLQHKTVLITGASRGLGEQVARVMWQQGANLILIARTKDKLQALHDDLIAQAVTQQTITVLAADLMDATGLEVLLQQVTAKPVDVLVNNAAIQEPIGPIWENDWQAWLATLQVNLLSPIALCRALVPHMIKQRHGKIINLAGGGATGPRQNFTAYAVAKTGIVRFSETLADEVKEFNIDVNCVSPGVMNTHMMAQLVAAGEEMLGAKEFNQAKNTIASDDSAIVRAAELCLFLATTPSDGITGKIISAAWDPWRKLPDYINDIKHSDIYTLRRIVPKDRGLAWGDV